MFMAAVHEDTCIGLFAFAVNLISSKKRKTTTNSQINIILRLARLTECRTQSFFLAYGTCTKILTRHQTDRQTKVVALFNN